MSQKLLSKRILVCLALYLYQSLLDLNRTSILDLYKTNSPIIGPQVAKFPIFFLLTFIMHRAFIHGLIVKVFTGEKKILYYYMVTDLIIFSAAALIVLSRRILPQFNDITEPLTFAFMKLLDTPILLLFFLPSFYLYKKMEQSTSDYTRN
ncbi:MAG: hypothetical protein J7604_00320 [Sporocytophaga sp.]|uniref:hypothetical protein n=1 Tax=Sporocytophaga sp. TaxID=2231183 RepID=UPI001B0860B9|nr:hypothetical protein [Sporocytophaga sp.]MBO9698616.1 hypothetical protein [Sporocytophaga sp.]